MRLIVIGCGRWGAGLAQVMSQRAHVVSVVDQNPAAFERLGESFHGRTITGVGFDREVLLAAGIERADALAAVMSSDEANVVAARVARQKFRVPRVVARQYDPRKAEIYRRLDVMTVSSTTWGIHRMTELLGYSDLESVASLGSGQVDLVETEIPALLVGRTVTELTLSGEVQVVAISRGSRTFLPTLGTAFQEGDRVHLAMQSTAADRLRRLLGKG
jgi:trk system potassium uptake protein TrkA